MELGRVEAEMTCSSAWMRESSACMMRCSAARTAVSIMSCTSCLDTPPSTEDIGGGTLVTDDEAAAAKSADRSNGIAAAPNEAAAVGIDGGKAAGVSVTVQGFGCGAVWTSIEATLQLLRSTSEKSLSVKVLRSCGGASTTRCSNQCAAADCSCCEVWTYSRAPSMAPE